MLIARCNKPGTTGSSNILRAVFVMHAVNLRPLELYPAHRLAQSYINASEQNITQGLDKSESPLMFFAGILIGTGMLGLSIRLMRHHRLHHHAYKAHEAANTQSSMVN